MKIGFTGTRRGMTEEQKSHVCHLLTKDLPMTEFHHGACEGADREAVELSPSPDVAYPSWIEGQWDWAHSNSKKIVGDGRLPPLVRNRMIVDAIELLIAAPGEKDEVLRSGTWATNSIRPKGRQETLDRVSEWASRIVPA